jgi:hypothetical protein
MFYIQGTETDQSQGIQIIHDAYHNGYLSIQIEDQSPTFSIQSSSNQTIISSSDLHVNSNQIFISELRHHDIVPRSLAIDQKGRIVSQSVTPNTLSITLSLLVIGLHLYSIRNIIW